MTYWPNKPSHSKRLEFSQTAVRRSNFAKGDHENVVEKESICDTAHPVVFRVVCYEGTNVLEEMSAFVIRTECYNVLRMIPFQNWMPQD
jgi:hypothetical protein